MDPDELCKQLLESAKEPSLQPFSVCAMPHCLHSKKS